MAEPAGARAPTRRSPRVPWWSVPLVVVGVLVVAELGARLLGPEIPRTAGSEERALIKADQIASRGGPTDLVVLGSSDAASGLVPATLLAAAPELDGAYNAALVGSTLALDQEWAERVVLPQLQPGLVIIAIQPSAVSDYSAVEDQLDPASDTGPSYRAAFDQIDPGGLGALGWELRQHSDLIRYRPYLRRPSLVVDGIGELLSGDDEPVDTTSPMDWVTEQDPERVAAFTGDDGEILEYREPSPPVTEAEAATAAYTAAGGLPADLDPLEDLVAAIRASGAEPVLALAPVDRAVLVEQGADLTGLDELAERLLRWADDEGVASFDRWRASWPADHFHDRQHTAEAGAERWSTELGEWLSEQCRAARWDACAP